MRFAHIILENWRNFRWVDVPLRSRAFLVGPNGSGKSNFLDVFRFLHDIVTSGGGFQRAVLDRGGLFRLRNLAAEDDYVAIQVALGEQEAVLWRYQLVFSQDGGRPVIVEERVWKGEAQILARPNADDRADAARLGQTYLEQTFANREFRAIADFFSSVHYYHLIPQLVRVPEQAAGRWFTPYGGDFLERLAGADEAAREDRLRRILAALEVAVPRMGGLRLERNEGGAPHLYGAYRYPAGEVWQSEADFSDGTLRLIGLLWSLLDGDGPLLLEEPESSLHPDVVRLIPQVLLRARGGERPRQVILSTHSADLLSDEGIAADEILLFVPERDGSRVRVGAEMAEVRSLLEAGLSPAEAVLPHTRPPGVSRLAFLNG